MLQKQQLCRVAGVFTAADLDGPTILQGQVPMFPEPMLNRPILATDTVRFVGECIAVILSETPETGADAAEAVSVDYEPLPVVVDMEEAATDSVVIYDEVGTNIAVDFSALGMATGITDDSFFGDCEVVVSGQKRTREQPQLLWSHVQPQLHGKAIRQLCGCQTRLHTGSRGH